MKKLYIDASKSTPEIHFDIEQNILSIKGQSYPENAYKFYEPVFEWVDNYLEQITTEDIVRIEFELAYINTSSSKCIMMLLDKFEDAYDEGKKISLNWYCSADNESEIECAEEFKEDLDFPFQIIGRDKV